MKIKSHIAFVVCVVAVTGCGAASNGGSDAGGGSSAPTMTGPLAFAPKSVLGSRQTSGGFNGKDNLSVSIGDTCSGLSNRSVSIQVFAAPNGSLAVGDYSVTGTASKARVSLSDSSGGGFKTYSAVSGAVTLTAVDVDGIFGNKGSYNVTLGSTDGGTSSLTGTFDMSYLCQ